MSLYLCDVATTLNQLPLTKLRELAIAHDYSKFSGKSEEESTADELIAYLASVAVRLAR